MRHHTRMFTIYFNPSDFPGQYVCREFVIDQDGACSMGSATTGQTLGDLRSRIPAGAYNLGRMPGDDPVIIETWIE